MIHHIAIATPNLNIMSEFYKKLPGLQWKEIKYKPDGEIRSVWFEVSHHCLLMLESFPYSKGPEALIFQINPSFKFSDNQFKIIKKTDYTLYFLDPDGNQLGYSSYPEKMDINLFIKFNQTRDSLK